MPTFCPICRRAIDRWGGPIWLHFAQSADILSNLHTGQNVPRWAILSSNTSANGPVCRWDALPDRLSHLPTGPSADGLSHLPTGPSADGPEHICVHSDRDTAEYTNRRSKSATKYASISDNNRGHKDISHTLAVSDTVDLQDSVHDFW